MGEVSKCRKIIGMATKVKKVDEIKPPIITHAMLTRVSEPAVIAKAVGSMPTIMVNEVIKIGFNLVLPDSIIASRGLIPLSINVKV